MGRMVEAIKEKMAWLRKRGKKKQEVRPYAKMEKSSSVKEEIRSRRVRRLIDRTLAVADNNPGKAHLPS